MSNTGNKTIAIIMARGGSKGLPKKNTKLLNGKPLIAYSIEDAINSGVCDTVLVTSEDDEIIEISKKYGATVSFKRPSELASDSIPPEPVIQHALKEHEKITSSKFDIVVYLQPTDIFRPKNVIRDCVSKLKNNPKIDTVFSAYKTHKHFWKKKNDGTYMRITEATYAARQERKDNITFREDQGIACAFRANLIRDKGIRVGNNVDIVENEDFKTSVDIHYDFDFSLAEILKSKENNSLNTFQEEFLGRNSKFWSQSIRNGYIRSHLIFAMHETGVFETLKKNKNLTTKEIAIKTNLNHILLDGVLNFLYHSDKILSKKNNKFNLTKFGLDNLFTDPVLAMSYGAVGAYSCILTELVPSLKNQKKYGKDYIRPGDLIAKGSYYTGRKNYPWIVDNMKKLGVKKVADLGCGSADVLISLCGEDKNLLGVGVDISQDALDEAQTRIEKRGLKNRISLVKGDLYRPETYSKTLQDVDAFNAVMVMHEFLRDGKERVVKMFQDMKKEFKGKYFFLGEFDCLNDSEYQKMPYPDRIHFLFYQYVIHPLTWQGLGFKEDWLEIFKKSGIEVVEINDKLSFRLVQFILKF
jgi:CMP-N-acetylneuraminic acid synthetase